jgi:hypothetical protein
VSHWTADGKNFMVIMDTTEGTKTLVAPVSEATGLPALPPAGLATIAEMESVKGAKIIDGPVLLGPTPGLSATVREDVHRNLYRVPLQ